MGVGRNPRSWAVAAAVALGLNSAYLALRQDPTPFYFANVVAHLALGLFLAVVIVPRLPRAFRGFGPFEKSAAAALVAATLVGVVLMFTGTTRPYRPLLAVHIALAALGALLLLAGVLRGALAWIPRPAAGRALALAALAGAVLTPGLRYYADHHAPNGRRIVNPALPPDSMDGEGPGPRSPFFPSSSETNTGKIIPANFFMTSADCGR